MLNGKKTYILAAFLLAAGVAQTQGWISLENYNLLESLLLPGSLMALRSGVEKNTK